MRQEITVDKAIKRGHLIVNVPVIISIIGIPAYAYILSVEGYIPQWGIAAALVTGIILAWVIWGFMITRWRIWAFENVRNVHELKKRAIEEKLIWKDGSIFEKTEIRNRQDILKLQQLEKKFAREDEYKEYFTVPPKTLIYYSKLHTRLEFGISLVIIGVGVYLFTMSDTKNYIFGTVMTGIGLYSAVKESFKVFNKKPQIIIDSKGISTMNTEFREWSFIEGEEVIREGYGKSTKYFLTYYYDEDGFEKTDLSNLNIKHRELENIVRTYRIRHDKNYR